MKREISKAKVASNGKESHCPIIADLAMIDCYHTNAGQSPAREFEYSGLGFHQDGQYLYLYLGKARKNAFPTIARLPLNELKPVYADFKAWLTESDKAKKKALLPSNVPITNQYWNDWQGKGKAIDWLTASQSIVDVCLLGMDTKGNGLFEVRYYAFVAEKASDRRCNLYEFAMPKDSFLALLQAIGKSEVLYDTKPSPDTVKRLITAAVSDLSGKEASELAGLI